MLPAPTEDLGISIRSAGRDALAESLMQSRRDTLATFARIESALAGRAVPQRAEFNPPLWELGHIGWFQEFWLSRNPERHRGAAADPLAARAPGVRPHADALYDSSHVPHDTRWSLPLPDAAATQRDLAQQLQQTLRLLRSAPADDTGLYFFRLALLHEDMHHEAALILAQALDLHIDDERWQPRRAARAMQRLPFAAGNGLRGAAGPGFAFDNELGLHGVPLRAFDIDSRVVCWAEYLPFVEATGAAPPPHVRRDEGTWQQQRFGRWEELDPASPACHISAVQAQAWCAWAGRRLPAEAEWERAAIESAESFIWGSVWEWTASTFDAFPGFVAHPYRDYSAPWFGTRRVLRGASVATQPRMRHPLYRNFYAPERDDIFAGFRSCAI